MSEDNEKLNIDSDGVNGAGNGEPDKQAQKGTKSKKKKSLFFRIIKYTFLFAFLFLLAIAILSQTTFFKTWILDIALSKVNNSAVKKGSKIYARSLQGSILWGIKLNDAGIVVQTDTLVKMEYVDISYDLWGLLTNEIRVNELILQSPEINFTTVKDENDSLKWNYTQIFDSTPDTTVDTSTSKFDWHIIISDFKLNNASFRSLEFKDSDLPIRDIAMQNLDSFNFSYLDVTDLNIDLSGEYADGYKKLDIKTLNFETNSEFDIKNLSLKTELNEKTGTKLENFSLITNRTNLQIPQLYFGNFDPFGEVVYEDFGDKNVNLKLVTNKFNFDDLSFFFPDLDFLDNEVYLALDANGKYGNLGIDKLLLKTNRSVYNLAGKIENLQEPSKMRFNVIGRNMDINPADTKEILPGLPIPDYNYLGSVSIPYVTYIGTVDRFHSDFDFNSSAGSANGKVFLDLTQNELIYRTDLKTNNVNIGKIVKDNSLESSINAEIIADGRGFDYRTMNTRVNYKLNSTRFFDQNISSSEGQIDLNDGNVKLNVIYASNSGQIKTEGTANIKDIDQMTYDLKGSAQNLNIQSITKDASQNSNLNFTFDINGKGLDPDNISGKFDFGINPSKFGDFIIPQTPLVAIIENTDEGKTVDVQSDILDVNAEGKFSITSLAQVITDNLQQVTTEFQNRLATTAPEDSTEVTDSNFVSTTPSYSNTSFDQNINQSFTGSAGSPEVDMNYTIKIKNLVPLKNYIDSNFVLRGDIRGSIKNSDNIFDLTADMDLYDFAYGDSVLILTDSKIDIQFQNNITLPGLEGFSANVNIFSDSSIVSGFQVDTLGIGLLTDETQNSYGIYGLIDTSFIFAQGMINLYDGKTEVITDSIGIKFRNLNLSYRDTLLFDYVNAVDESYIDFKEFKLRDGNQRIEVEGKLSLDKESDLEISGNNLVINAIELLRNPKTAEQEKINGNLRRVEIIYKGTFSNPDVYAEINSDPLYIEENNAIGRFDAIVEYKDQLLKPDISFYNPNNVGNLKVYGEIPIIIGGKDSAKTEIDTAEFREKNVDLYVDANNFQLNLLGRFVPNLSDVTGGMDGKLTANGTVSDPILSGNLDLNDARFKVDMTKMYYGMNANLTTDGERLVLTGSKLFVPDEPSKFLTTTGYIDFTNLTFNEINFDIQGTLKALDKDNGATDFGIYGDLYVGSGSPSLKLTGNQEKILFDGNLVLINGNVIMNPLGIKNSYNIYEDDGFTYTVKIDSSTVSDTTIMAMKQELIALSKENNATLNPFERYFLPVDTTRQTQDTTKPSRFLYDLHMTTERDLYLTFIVNEKTRQEFFGNVDVDMKVSSNDKGDMQAYGNVKLGDNSYYRFYRRFKAQGDIEFFGPITNPELDVKAEYTTAYTSGNNAVSTTDQYKVLLTVTGTATNPKLEFQVEQNSSQVGGSDPTNAAISVILFGRLEAGSNVLSSVGTNIGSIFVSDYLSNVVQEVLPFIVNTNINYVDSDNGNVVQNTDLSFTAQFGDATVKFGGQIFDDISNSNIVIEYPLNKLFKMKGLSNNLILQIERVVDPFTGLDANSTEIRTGALIYYRIKF